MLEISSVRDSVRQARAAAPALAVTSTVIKNAVLRDLATRLETQMDVVLAANASDVTEAEVANMNPSLVDRLLLTPARLVSMSADLRKLADLPDPVGEEFDTSTLPNGLQIRRVRVPLGLIAVIYESRPNVTVDVAALCLKSGNAVVLRGGKESRRSSAALVELIHAALEANGVPASAVQMVHDPDRALIGELIRLRGEVDLVIPRGGQGLIQYVREHAQVPVVAGGVGVCHTYVHADADLNEALEIVHNAKTRRPSVCNALDTVLVHRAIAAPFLGMLAERWAQVPVEMRCDEHSFALLEQLGTLGPRRRAQPDDFGQEFLALCVAIKVVNSLDEAIDHIRTYGSGHSEAIITEGWAPARTFVGQIDAAAVYVNASTAFTDGAEFGLGAEIGISTQKFHARGPLGLRELTSYKWVILGDGQIRP